MTYRGAVILFTALYSVLCLFYTHFIPRIMLVLWVLVVRRYKVAAVYTAYYACYFANVANVRGTFKVPRTYYDPLSIFPL